MAPNLLHKFAAFKELSILVSLKMGATLFFAKELDLL
jgi:hypothetical protein